jgi:hypothetical protein
MSDKQPLLEAAGKSVGNVNNELKKPSPLSKYD